MMEIILSIGDTYAFSIAIGTMAIIALVHLTLSRKTAIIVSSSVVAFATAILWTQSITDDMLKKQINSNIEHIRSIEYQKLDDIANRHKIDNIPYDYEFVVTDKTGNQYTLINMYVYRKSNELPVQKISLKKYSNGQLEVLEHYKLDRNK